VAVSSEESSPIAAEVGAQCRADFLHALGYLNLDAIEGATLAEVFVGRRFASCAPSDIRKVVEEVREMLHRTTLVPETLVHV
jgi:hypothetical protein